MSTGGTRVGVTDPPIVDITVSIDIVVSDPNAEGLRTELDNIAQSIMEFWNNGLPSDGLPICRD